MFQTLGEEAMDHQDVSWIDRDEDMEVEQRVKQITSRQRRALRMQDTMDPSELEVGVSSTLFLFSIELETDHLQQGPAFRKSTVPANATSKQWCAQESKLRNGGTARSVVASAITSIVNPKAKPGAPRGSGPVKKAAGATSARGPMKPVKSAASALSLLGDRSASFA